MILKVNSYNAHSFFDNGFILLKNILSSITSGLCITKMHIAATLWCVVDDQLGTPRGRCDVHNGKFSLSYKTKV
jgi:hypothetical protein